MSVYHQLAYVDNCADVVDRLLIYYLPIKLNPHEQKIRLRLPYRNDAKIAKICKKMVYWLNYRPKCPEVADFYYFGIIPIW